MKKNLLLALLCLCPALAFAQNPVPNPGFETWSGGQPTGWYVNNLQGGPPTGTQSNDARGGVSAFKGEVVNFFGAALAPSFFAGSLSNQFFPVTQKYARLSGYYKFSPAGPDTFSLGVSIYDANTNAFGGGGIKISAAASAYTRFEIILQYDSGSFTPAFASIVGSIGGANNNPATIGSFVLLDDLELSGIVTGVVENATANQPVTITLHQNYPNPFNPSTTFSFSLPEASHAELAIFNALGQEVARLVDQHLPAGDHRRQWEAAALPAGLYVYRLQAAGHQLTKKLLLVK
jgi:hypothetical protein